MEPITSQRAYVRAQRELEFLDRQLDDIKAKRDAAIAMFDAAETLLRESRGQIANAMQAFKTPGPALKEAI